MIVFCFRCEVVEDQGLAGETRAARGSRGGGAALDGASRAICNGAGLAGGGRLAGVVASHFEGLPSDGGATMLRGFELWPCCLAVPFSGLRQFLH